MRVVEHGVPAPGPVIGVSPYAVTRNVFFLVGANLLVPEIPNIPVATNLNGVPFQQVNNSANTFITALNHSKIPDNPVTLEMFKASASSPASKSILHLLMFLSNNAEALLRERAKEFGTRMTRREVPVDLTPSIFMGFIQVLWKDDPCLIAPGQFPFTETDFTQKLDTGYEWIGLSQRIEVVTKFLVEAGSTEDPFAASLALWRCPVSKRLQEAHFL